MSAGETPSPQPLDLGEPGGLSYRLKQCRHGRFLYNLNDMYIGRSLDAYGEYSEAELQGMLRFLRAGDVVVEAGANIGTLTVPFATKVGSTGYVHAFEPERLIHQLLAANIALNALSNVSTYRLALGATKARALMPAIDHRSYTNYGAWSPIQQGAGEPVEVRPIDSLGLQRCNFIKADVEGMELQVLQGAADTIARHRPFLYVENNPGPHAKPLIEHVLSIGYRLFWHITMLYEPTNFFGNPENVFGFAGSSNMICVPRTSRVVIGGLQEITSPDEPPPIGPARPESTPPPPLKV